MYFQNCLPRCAQTLDVRLDAGGVPADWSRMRSYRCMVINNRLLLVDPATSIGIAEVTD
jgi:hypothetical protein